MLDANSSPCEGVEVVFSLGGVDTTVLTDNTGVAEYTYTAQSVSGTGEVSVIVSCGSLVETCNFYDVFLFDDCSTDHTNQYTLNQNRAGNSNVSLVFDTDHYTMSGSGGTFSGITFTELNDMDNVEISFDVKLTQTSAFNQMFMIISPDLNSSNQNNFNGFRMRGDRLLQKNTPTTESTIYTHNTSYTDQYYHFVFKRQGTSLIIELYDENSVLLTSGNLVSSLDLTHIYYTLWTQTERGVDYKIFLKNLKIVEL